MTTSLSGHFLISTPGMADPRFTDSVIFLVGHNEEGAMGLTINQPVPDIKFGEILADLDLGPSADIIRLPKAVRERPVLCGGPVETERGFVLHSTDFGGEQKNAFSVAPEVQLSATLEMLRAISFGPGPRDSLFALGYCGWSAGQLEEELKHDGWLTAPYSRDLLFGTPIDARYKTALGLLGINHASLSPQIGNA